MSKARWATLAVFLAACGGGGSFKPTRDLGTGLGVDAGGMCGNLNQNCCTNQSCNGGLACMNGKCAQVSCGHLGMTCCSNAVCTDANTVCMNNQCVAGTCGTLGEPCCDLACTDGTSVCMNGLCVAPNNCGATNGPCCANNSCNNLSDTCQNGICVPAQNCGAIGQACCNGINCNAGVCMNGVCVNQQGLGNSGDPCLKAADCGGTKPTCITKDGNGVTWPGGYCTSSCNPANTDQQTGLNTDCPGGAGVCIGNSNPGVCESACTAMNGQMPCTRQGYSCFEGCEPTAESMCNPTVKGQCGQGMSCVRIGADDVGQCAMACSPFTQGCADINGAPAGCYASDDNGEGACSPVYEDNMDGVACSYLNDCHPGLACYDNGNGAVCRPYCGGPNNVACNNGNLCVDLSMSVQKATVGACGG
jgi:hypothetical protein